LTLSGYFCNSYTFKDARDYINAVMNGRTDPPPIREWSAEQKKLTATKCAACERYYALQDEVRSIDSYAGARII